MRTADAAHNLLPAPSQREPAVVPVKGQALPPGTSSPASKPGGSSASKAAPLAFLRALETVPASRCRYELVKPLGTGGMAELFLARARDDEAWASRPVVVKRLRKDVLGNEVIESLFKSEGW